MYDECTDVGATGMCGCVSPMASRLQRCCSTPSPALLRPSVLPSHALRPRVHHASSPAVLGYLMPPVHHRTRPSLSHLTQHSNAALHQDRIHHSDHCRLRPAQQASALVTAVRCLSRSST